MLGAENFTGYFDELNKPIYLGDKLRSEWGYDVIVYKLDNGEYVGKLVCDSKHFCRDIPYSLNKGIGYSKICEH